MDSDEKSKSVETQPKVFQQNQEKKDLRVKKENKTPAPVRSAPQPPAQKQTVPFVKQTKQETAVDRINTPRPDKSEETHLETKDEVLSEEQEQNVPDTDPKEESVDGESNVSDEKNIEEEKEEKPLTKEQTNHLMDVLRRPENISALIKILMGSREDALMQVDKYRASHSDDEIREMLEDNLSYLNSLVGADRVFEYEGQAGSDRVMFEEMCNERKQVPKRPQDKIADQTYRGKKYGKEKGSIVLSGPEAETAFMAKMRGLKRCVLLNSGFRVGIRSFGLAELNEFFNSVHEESQEIGHILGGHTFLYNDLFIKDKFMELIPLVIENCNITGWNQGNTFARNLSFHDYDTLIWMACCLQYRQGIEIELVCTNPDCEHIDRNHKIDLNKMRMAFFDLIPNEAMAFLEQSKEVKTEELHKFRNKLLGFKKRVVIKCEDGHLAYNLKVPTIGEYLDYGKRLVGEMASAIQGDFTIQNERARNTQAINMYKMQRPWIESMEYLDGPDGEAEIITKDENAIVKSLDALQQDQATLLEEISQFRMETKLSYICYTGLKCPKCGKEPGSSIDDYYVYDPQNLFFFLCCRRLVLAGLE